MSERTELSSANSSEEELLTGIQPAVIEILGKDVVLAIEQTYGFLVTVDDLAKQPNPFDAKKPYELDLSSIDIDQRKKAQLEEFIKKHSSPKGRQELLAGLYSGAIFSRSQKLNKLGVDVYEACYRQAKEVSATLDRSGEEIDRLLADLGPADVKAPSFEDINDQIVALNGAAGNLPTEATIRAIKDLFDIVVDLDEKIVDRSWLGVMKGTISRYQGAAVRNKERVEKLNKFVQVVRELGHSTYEMIRPALQVKEIDAALGILGWLDEAKKSLANTSGSEQYLQDSLVVERYLQTEVAKVELILKALPPRILEIPEVRSFLGGLRSTPLSDAERSRQVKEDQEKVRDLNNAVSEARDILNAPHRLEVKNQERIQKIADSLYALSRTKESPLTAEENGVVVAIIAGKFESFCRTLSSLQTTEKDERLVIIERQRLEAVKRLRSFNLSGAMDKIKLAVDQYSDMLREVLSSEEFVKLELGVEKFYEIAENAERPVPSALKIEDVLDNGELFSRLDWTVLPRGEFELERAAREIVATAQERAEKGAHIQIDLERLIVLRNIKEKWGADRCYYARGTLSGRGRVTVEGVEQPDEYIVLVLQNLDGDGRITTEHAVAESPIAGHNATYVLRGDVTEFSWRDVYSLSKKDARALGARAVKHTKGDGSGLVNVMTNRVSYLLSCEPVEFSAIRFSGRYIRLARQLGEISSAA